MIGLRPWLRGVKARLRRTRQSSDPYLLSEADLRFEAARERIRADRSGSPLSILIIRLPRDRAQPRDLDFLARVLERRLRITDTAGRLSPRTIGVLLPDTPKEGGWKVASDVCDFYPVGHDRPDCDVHVYPDEANPPGENHRAADRLATRRDAKLDSLFAHPTPFVKRAVDVLGASMGLLVAAPFLACAAVAIKVSSSGPVFFAQEREGHGGRRFSIYKLRSMHCDAHHHQGALRAYNEQDGPAFKMRNDPRTTRVGRFLRRTSLDELPQLWNVLVGDMSLVGPRPLPVAESEQCEPWQRARLNVVPGMTCVWQVSGRNTVSFNEWMRMDMDYLRRRSLVFDFLLLLRTLPSLLLHRGPR
jgi:lipopolysaccharide/colanic/teichoic acid biosynthesis glycosyltransferase